MGVECKFDKNYNVTSDWSLENMTERGPSDSSRSSLPSLHLIPDPPAHPGLPVPCYPLLSPLLESSCSPPHPTLTLLSPLCETYISVDRI